MTYEYITVEREERLTIITINRPAAFNALNAAAHREMETAFNDFQADSEQWVAIVTGAGEKAFCAGHDLKQQADGGGIDLPPTGFGGITSRFDLNKPVIAAVNGVALGGGFEIALACDLIVASSKASFALPEVKVGLVALAGGTKRLAQELGLKRTMGLILTGRRVFAQEGHELGFVNEVVEGDVLEAAKRWAAEILAASPMSVRATKQAVLSGLTEPASTAVASSWTYPAVKEMFASQDAIEGPKAFAEKRTPVWQGK